jgi:hypothetical protein
MALRYKANDLFTPGPIMRLNACAGMNGGPYDFRDYAHGYFLAARKLLNNLREDSAYVDTLVYPLAFLFRHGIELSLKGLARDLSQLFRQQGNIRLTHKLSDNWASVRALLQRRPGEFDPDNTLIPLVDKVLNDYLEFDPSSEVFRFPEDRAGNLFLQDARIINVEVFGSVLDGVADIFDYWFFQAGRLAEYRRESGYEV